LCVNVYDRLTPLQIGLYAFALSHRIAIAEIRHVEFEEAG
jgi:hypothetical protein